MADQPFDVVEGVLALSGLGVAPADLDPNPAEAGLVDLVECLLMECECLFVATPGDVEAVAGVRPEA
jgi:hypothetical protein